jgi:hypothetical protein
MELSDDKDDFTHSLYYDYNANLLDRLITYDPVRFTSPIIIQKFERPNVMECSTYLSAYKEYKDDVHWCNISGLGDYAKKAISFASRSVGERKKIHIREISYLEKIEFEIRALSLGFPLGQNESFTKSDTAEHAVISELITKQSKKPLWTFLRLGSNYYICATHWCYNDDLPILESEFVGSVTRTGIAKLPNSCPFCGGTEKTTVLSRNAINHIYINKYIGFHKSATPTNHAIPICKKHPYSTTAPKDAIL